MADRSIDKREQYVGYDATHCLKLTKATADRESRAVLKEMAAEVALVARFPSFNQSAQFRALSSTISREGASWQRVGGG